MEFQNRQALFPGRIKLIPVEGQTGVYDVELMDQATQVGTPLNAETLNQFKQEILDSALDLNIKGETGAHITNITITPV